MSLKSYLGKCIGGIALGATLLAGSSFYNKSPGNIETLSRINQERERKGVLAVPGYVAKDMGYRIENREYAGALGEGMAAVGTVLIPMYPIFGRRRKREEKKEDDKSS